VHACATCGCTRDAAAHAVTAALREDDFDRALAGGLLDCACCDGCSPACTAALLVARAVRLRALAARERFRAREARLARRRRERAERRGNAADAPDKPERPALPAAAVAALARARARIAERNKE
jgi:Na+-translocating ferredoxin:NAD+ oxidoreductase RnfC subunit